MRLIRTILETFVKAPNNKFKFYLNFCFKLSAIFNFNFFACIFYLVTFFHLLFFNIMFRVSFSLLLCLVSLHLFFSQYLMSCCFLTVLLLFNSLYDSMDFILMPSLSISDCGSPLSQNLNTVNSECGESGPNSCDGESPICPWDVVKRSPAAVQQLKFPNVQMSFAV